MLHWPGHERLGGALASAARGMGHRRGAPAGAAVVGREVGVARAEVPAFIRLLSLPGQPAVTAARATRVTTARSCSTTTTRASAPAAPARARRRPPASTGTGRPTGVARVVCYSPRHDVTLAELDVEGVDACSRRWQQQKRELGARTGGAVRAHLREQGRGRRRQQPAPALPDLRDQLRLQDHRDRGARRRRHLAETGRVAVPGHPRGRAAGRAAHPRARTRRAVAFVPYFARYAYETYVAPQRERADHRRSRRRRASRLRRRCCATC